jgi:hypothetical protein
VSGDAPLALVGFEAADEDTVGLLEVAHGRTLGKELGVGHHLERHALITTSTYTTHDTTIADPGVSTQVVV